MKVYNAALDPNIRFEDAVRVVEGCGAIIESGVASTDSKLVFVLVTFSADEATLAKVRSLPCVVSVSENMPGKAMRH